MENNTIFGRNITIGGITVDTKIKWTKEENKLYGYIGQCKFIWKYSRFQYPKLESGNTTEYRRMAKNFIIESFVQNNIPYSDILKTAFKSRDSIVFDEKDGLWFSVYINGYVRGQMDGCNFVWDTKKYKTILFINTNNSIVKGDSNDSSRIMKRIRQEGYHSANELIDAINSKKSTFKSAEVEINYEDSGAFLSNNNNNNENNDPCATNTVASSNVNKKNKEVKNNTNPSKSNYLCTNIQIDYSNRNLKLEDLELDIGNF